MWPGCWTGFTGGRVLRQRGWRGSGVIEPRPMEAMETCSETGLAMLELRDLALGITAVLQAVKEPEPLGVDLWNHSPETAAYLVTAVLDECSDGGFGLARVRIDPYVAVAMRKPTSGIGGLTGTSPSRSTPPCFSGQNFIACHNSWMSSACHLPTFTRRLGGRQPELSGIAARRRHGNYGSV